MIVQVALCPHQRGSFFIPIYSIKLPATDEGITGPQAIRHARTSPPFYVYLYFPLIVLGLKLSII